MTKENFTSINILLDRSGSMGKLAPETLAGFNKFLADQKALDGEAVLSLATFANDYKLVHNSLPLQDTANLTMEQYNPAGYTALLDSLGRFIDDVGVKLAAMNEYDRPSKVITVVITDGEENSSKLFSRDQVFEKISHQTNKYGWLFVFLGCSQEQIKDAVKYGVAANNSFLYSNTSAGVTKAFTSISENMSSYRIGTAQQVNFFDQNATINKPISVEPTTVVVPTTIADVVSK
jgi:hypothetical protein